MNTMKSPPAAVKGLLWPASWMCVTVLTCWHQELRGENTESQEGRQNVGQDSFSVIPPRLFFLMYCNVGMYFIVITLYYSIYRQLKLLATPLYSSSSIFKNKKIHFSFHHFTGEKKYFRHQMN